LLVWIVVAERFWVWIQTKDENSDSRRAPSARFPGGHGPAGAFGALSARRAPSAHGPASAFGALGERLGA